MYRRQPSSNANSSPGPSSSASRDTSSVRRCSGQARPFISGVADNSYEVGDHTNCSYEGDTDVSTSMPVESSTCQPTTVLLVKSHCEPSQRYVSGPQVPSFKVVARSPARVVITTNSVNSHPLDVESVESESRPASPQELIPCQRAHYALPPGLARASLRASSSSSASTSTTTSSPSQASVSPHTRCSSLKSLQMSPLLKDVACLSNELTSTYSSGSPFNDSQYTLISPISSTSGSTFPPFLTSIDSGRTTLIPSLNTTARFTHRWPVSRALRTVPVIEQTGKDRLPKSPSQTDISLLEVEQGLKMRTVRERWTPHKWCLLASVTIVFICGLVCLACAAMTWIQGWNHAIVLITADYSVLVFVTLTGCMYLFTSLLGIAGLILDSRRLLALYATLLWPAFMSLLTVGYLAYKRATFALDDKLDQAWSEGYTPQDRLAIQDSLRCCGYFDAMHEAVFSKRCFPRSVLPGCKGPLYRFETASLSGIWAVAFGLVPMQIVNLVVALVCANHVTRAFGADDNITPAYCRLTAEDVKSEAEILLQSSRNYIASEKPLQGF